MRRSIAFLFGVLLVLSMSGIAEAHAQLVRAVPAAGALLQTAPPTIELEFTEPLDPAFSRVQLLNSGGQVLAAGPGVIDSATPTLLHLALPSLPVGSYTAVWRVRSATDGHVTEGNLPFGVGVASAAVPAPAAAPAVDAVPPLESGLRWLNLLAITAMLGGIPFSVLVWLPALRATQRSAPPAQQAQLRAAAYAMSTAMRWLVWTGAVCLVVFGVLLLAAQAATAAGVPFAAAWGGPLAQMLQDRTGVLALARFGLALVLALLAWRAPLGERICWQHWAALVLGGALLLCWSLQSHSAAQPNNAALAVALDWLHLAATVAWLGGLLPLAVAIDAVRRAGARAVPLDTLVPRFSRLALAAVVVLVLSGLYSYTQNVGQLALLPATTYGRALLIKGALFGLLLLGGAANLLAFGPRIRAATGGVVALARTVRGELALGTLVLLAVGVMTSVAPSNAAEQAGAQRGMHQAITVDGVELALQVDPAQIGENTFTIAVRDPRANADTAASRVLLRFQSLDMPMGTLEAQAEPTGANQFQARGTFLSMNGRWQVEVILRKAGLDDVRHTFDLAVGS